MSNSMWLKVGLVAGIAGAMVGITTLIAKHTGGDSAVENCLTVGEANKVLCDYSHAVDIGERRREDEVLAVSRAYASVTPKGEGPWPFAVVRTGGVGLKIRSTNLPEAIPLGRLAQFEIAWAICMENSGFDPEPTTRTGPIWLKIKWDVTERSNDFHSSDSFAGSTGWAYRGYLVPVGHNGAMPNCA